MYGLTKYNKSERFYQNNCRKIVKIETNEIYRSIKEAADAHYVSPSSIKYALKDAKNRKCANFHWKYYEDSK